jgi:hypothetical protein
MMIKHDSEKEDATKWRIMMTGVRIDKASYTIDVQLLAGLIEGVLIIEMNVCA